MYVRVLEEKHRVNLNRMSEQIENSAGINEEELIRSGICVVVCEAICGLARNNVHKIAVRAFGEEMNKVDDDEGKNGDAGLFAGLFGGNEEQIPDIMAEAMEWGMSVICYVELFGAPESSPESSSFIRGPRCDLVVQDMQYKPCATFELNPLCRYWAISSWVEMDPNPIDWQLAMRHLVWPSENLPQQII